MITNFQSKLEVPPARIEREFAVVNFSEMLDALPPEIADQFEGSERITSVTLTVSCTSEFDQVSQRICCITNGSEVALKKEPFSATFSFEGSHPLRGGKDAIKSLIDDSGQVHELVKKIHAALAGAC